MELGWNAEIEYLHRIKRVWPDNYLIHAFVDVFDPELSEFSIHLTYKGVREALLDIAFSMGSVETGSPQNHGNRQARIQTESNSSSSESLQNSPR